MFRFKEPTKREILLGYMAIGIVLLAISYSFIFEPIFKKYNLLNQKIIFLERKLSKYQILIQNQEKIRQICKSYLFVSLLDNTTEKGTIEVLKEIENLVKSNNLVLINIKPQDSSSIAESTIEMKIEGPIKNISQFIYNLEKFLYPLSIKELLLRPGNVGENILECNLIIKQNPILNPNQ